MKNNLYLIIIDIYLYLSIIIINCDLIIIWLTNLVLCLGDQFLKSLSGLFILFND